MHALLHINYLHQIDKINSNTFLLILSQLDHRIHSTIDWLNQSIGKTLSALFSRSYVNQKELYIVKEESGFKNIKTHLYSQIYFSAEPVEQGLDLVQGFVPFDAFPHSD